MANICITSVCNRDCSYCFSQPNAKTPPFMGVQRFRQALAFLKRSEVRQVRILGGEPTLHPDFEEIMNLALQTGCDIQFFSNGFMPEKALEILSSMDPSRVTVVLNATPFLTSNGKHSDRPRAVLRRLGRTAMLGVTICNKNETLERLIPVIENAAIQRMIRLGLALPCLHEKNEWLRPTHYRDTGARLIEFATEASRRNIRISLDCGFVPCMFGEDGIDMLRRCHADLNWNCGPVLDIATNGRAFHCFPLAEELSIPLNGHLTAHAVREKFFKQSRFLRSKNIFRECARCEWRQSEECPGGCLAIVLQRNWTSRRCIQA